ncbi:MAG: PAS domain S-box protein [Proteobacteria bacterium]|nr:PAS domain S-box protein [Pseudomonadota bacterium]
MEKPNDLPAEFRETEAALLRSRVCLLLLVGGLVFAAFGIVDYLVFPFYFKSFIVYRLAAALVCLALFVLACFRDLGRWNFPVGAAAFYVMGAVVIKMVIDLGPSGVMYSVGLSVLLLVFNVIMIAEVKWLAFHSLVLCLAFFALVPKSDDPTIRTLYVSNLIIIGFTLAILLSVAWINRQYRYREFLALHGLREARAELNLSNSRLRQALKDAQTQYRLIVDRANEAITVIQDGRFVFCNPKGLEITGFRADEITGFPVSGLLPPDDPPLFDDSWPAGREAGDEGLVPRTFRILDRQGRSKWVEATAARLDWAGRPAALIMFSDVTQKKAAERLLLASEERYRKLFLNSPDVIFTLSAESGAIISINPVFETITGWRVEGWIGRPFLDILNPDDRELAEANYLQVLGGQYTAPFEIRVLTRNGEYKVGEFIAGPEMIDGRVVGVFGFARDMTDHIRAEEEVRASLKEKEILLKEIHHRVKNNLTVISSLINLQSRQIDDPGQAETFRDLTHRIQSMALIHEMLYRSANLADIDLTDYVRNLLEALTGAYSNPRIRTVANARAGGLFLDLNQAIPCALVLNELVSNAFKHAFPGDRAGRLEITTGRNDDGRLWVEVRDDGVGFPEGLDFRDTRTLGLQLVRDLVEKQLRGRVAMASGPGTTFTIEL